MGFGEGGVGVGSVDDIGFDFEGDAESDVSGVTVDGSEETEDLLVFEFDGYIGGGAPLGGVFAVDELEGESVGGAVLVGFLEGEFDTLAGSLASGAFWSAAAGAEESELEGGEVFGVGVFGAGSAEGEAFSPVTVVWFDVAEGNQFIGDPSVVGVGIPGGVVACTVW